MGSAYRSTKKYNACRCTLALDIKLIYTKLSIDDNQYRSIIIIDLDKETYYSLHWLC